MRAALIGLVVGALGCRDDAQPPSTHTLSHYLESVVGTEQASLAHEVASWKLDRALWERTVVATYRPIYDEYAAAFDAAAPALVTQLASRTPVTTRAHYAGDPRLTVDQARARWALPVQFPSEVAELADAPLRAVFVRDGEHWRAILGIDPIVRARVHKLDHGCGRYLSSMRTGRCSDVGWVIAEAALAADLTRFAHACALAANLCAP